MPCAAFTVREGMDIQNQARFTTKIHEQLRPTSGCGLPALSGQRRSLEETEGVGSHRPRRRSVRLFSHPNLVKLDVQVTSGFPPGPAIGLSLLYSSSWQRSFPTMVRGF